MPWVILPLLSRFGGRVRLAVMSDVGGGHKKSRAYWQLYSFVLDLRQQFLVAKIRSFLELQIVFFKKSGFNHQYNQAGILVFILNPEAILNIFRLRDYT